MPSESAPEPAVAHRRSCQRVSAPPPPHRSGLEACRSQLHDGARALHQPLFSHFLGPPVGRPILSSAGGIRTHDLELMRLARTAAPLPRVARRRGRGLCPRPLTHVVVSARSRHAPAKPGRTSRGYSGGRARTCFSRLTVARLTDSTTPERSGRRGSRTPKALKPTRFRDGVPRRWQSFQVAPAGVEPATLRLRGGSSAS